MKIIVFSVCYNESDILPFYLRHYSSFADEISVFDDHSDDGGAALLRTCPKVVFREWPYRNGIDEDQFLNFAYEWYPKAHPSFDWAIWCDIDEFVFHPNIRQALEQAMADGYEAIKPDGFNMMHEGLPKDDGRQIWEICNAGVVAPVYSKPIIFRPNCGIRWNRGKHDVEGFNGKILHDSAFKLLHYRYLGYDYTKARNARNYARVPGDKGAAWSCRPDYHGEHSPEWAAEALTLAQRIL